MSNSKVGKNSWIVILPVGAVAVVYIVWFYLPGTKAIAELRDQIRAKQDFVAESEKSVKALAAGKRELEKTEAYVSVCRLRASDEAELGNVLSTIHETANQAKLRIIRFDPQPPVVYERLRRVPVTVGLVGPFVQIHRFLRSLEEMPSYIWIRSTRLETDVKNGKDVIGEVVLEVFVGNSESSGCTVSSN